MDHVNIRTDDLSADLCKSIPGHDHDHDGDHDDDRDVVHCTTVARPEAIEFLIFLKIN